MRRPRSQFATILDDLSVYGAALVVVGGVTLYGVRTATTTRSGGDIVAIVPAHACKSCKASGQDPRATHPPAEE